MPIRFRPPRDIPDLGLTPGQQERFNAWLRVAFTEIAEDMASLGRSDAPTTVAQETIDVAAGSLRRVTPPVGGMTVRVPAPTPANAGQTVRIMIEAPVGDLTVVAVPGIGDDGKVFQPTINGASQATFSASGLVTLTSNGSSDWKSASEFAAESPASVAISSGGAALDAQYLLRAANASLPNARVADDSTEIDLDYSLPGLLSWFLKTASVAFSKLANLAGLSVLGRAANSSGVMAAITATSARQVLRANNAATGLEWDFPVSVGTWVFDGTSYIEGPDALHFERTQPFSLHAKITVSGASAQYVLSNQATDGTLRGFAVWLKFTPPSGIVFELASSGANRIRVYVSGSLTDLNDGLEHSIIFTYDGTSGTGTSSVDIYIDGTLETTTSLEGNSVTATTVPSAANFIVGASPTGTSIWSGSIRDVAVWDTQLSGAQVAEVYNGGADVDLTTLTSAADLQLWWGIVPSGGIDLSGKGLDGTANGTLGDQQIHSLAEGGGVEIAAASGTATLTREALTGAVSASAGSNATQFAGIRDNGTLETARGFLNLVSSTSVTLTGTQDTGNNEIEITAQRAALTGFAAASANSNATTSAEPIVTYSASANMSAERVTTSSTSVTVSTSVAGQIEFQRAALTGAIAASSNANATLFAGIRDNGSAENDRTNLNFLNSSTVNLTVTDDSGNDELEITAAVTSLPSALVTPTMLAVFGTPTNTGVPFVIYVSFAAGAGGSADDVTVFSASAPFAFRILEAWQVTATAVAASTVQARSASGGLGSALTTAMDASVTGKYSDNSTATTTVAASGSVFLRRSDSGIAGEFIALCVRT